MAEYISQFTIEGRKAVNILTDAYGFNLYSNDASASLTFSVQDGKLGVTGINY